MSIQDVMYGNSVPYSPEVLGKMSWEDLNAAGAKLEEEDNLWKQSQAQDAMKLAGLFGQVDVMSMREHQAYKDATGQAIDADGANPSLVEAQSNYIGKGGPNGVGVKTSEELRNQAQLLLRRGAAGTVQGIMQKLRQDWTSRGYIVK
jgi:hypothetical protein